jgi:hypothetical protein
MLNSIKIIGLIIENPRKKNMESKNLENQKKKASSVVSPVHTGAILG